LVFVFGYDIQKLAFKQTLYTTSYEQACLSRAMEFGRDKKEKKKNRLLEKHNFSSHLSKSIFTKHLIINNPVMYQ